MADDVDAANDTLEGFMAHELDERRRNLLRPIKCGKVTCNKDSYRTTNGVRTKFCRPCWEAEDSTPTSLEIEFAANPK